MNGTQLPAVTPAQLIGTVQAIAVSVGINLADVSTTERILTIAAAITLAGLLFAHDLFLRRGRQKHFGPAAGADLEQRIADVFEAYLSAAAETRATPRAPATPVPVRIAEAAAVSAEQAAAAEAANGPPAVPGADVEPEATGS